MSKSTKTIHRLWVVLLALAFLTGACRPATPVPQVEPEKTAPPAAQTEAEAVTESPLPESPDATETAVSPPPAVSEGMTVFARFEEQPVSVQPSLRHEPIAPDLSNVSNAFVLSPQQMERLAENGFVVTPGAEKEFFTVYEKARYANIPVFVTSDSLLHSYHLLFDKVLRTAERQFFIPLLRDLNASLLETAGAQYAALQGTAWEEAARRTVAFVAVAARLLDPSTQVPAYAADLADAELALIEAADGIQPSPIFPTYDFGEDYTQYIPRGHYTMSEDLTAYFKSMMWYGRMTFRLKTENPEAGRSETRQALLLAQALRTSQVNGRPALEPWADLYNPTAFFVGRSDDLTVLQYLGVMDEVYGPDAELATIADDSRLDAFIEATDRLPPPRILGMVIGDWQEEETTTKGMRFMGQRFVPDAFIFRQLIYRNVGTSGDRRGLPKGLDLMAAMGSERAYAHLDEMGDTRYENYPQQMEKMRTWLGGLSADEWTETLYNAWLYSFYPLLEVPGEGYPAFMQSEAWLDKQLNTSLGSWAELKHDTILYAKQVYAEMGGGPPAPQPVPPEGYVEPVPQFYARLAALTAMTVEGLEGRGLLNNLDRDNLVRLGELVRDFQTMAEKELRGEPLTEEEYNTIRFYGGELEHFVMAAADTDEADPFAEKYMDEEPQAAVIADVATDPDPDGDGAPNPVVLEEAVGRINEIHVVVPVVQADGSIRLQIAKGGVFSYYEFQWPADDRLTDEKWRTMLEENQAPDLPAWTGTFFTQEGEDVYIQATIQNFQRDVTYLFWEHGAYAEQDFPAGFEKLEQFKPEIQSLKEANQYIGHQLVQADILAYDYVSPDEVVVSVREVWDDNLYNGAYPEYGAEPIAHRGPYTLNVDYTLRRSETGEWPFWEVSGAVYADNPPAWEAR